jgi:hypothetical protein
MRKNARSKQEQNNEPFIHILGTLKHPLWLLDKLWKAQQPTSKSIALQNL